jgi:hypothetical protein
MFDERRPQTSDGMQSSLERAPMEYSVISRSRTLGAMLLLFVLVVAACGSDSDSPSSTHEATSTADVASDGDVGVADVNATEVAYRVVDTDQTWCFSEAIDCGEEFVGQGTEYDGVQPSYEDNGDGTVTDVNTGLM